MYLKAFIEKKQRLKEVVKPSGLYAILTPADIFVEKWQDKAKGVWARRSGIPWEGKYMGETKEKQISLVRSVVQTHLSADFLSPGIILTSSSWYRNVETGHLHNRKFMPGF